MFEAVRFEFIYLDLMPHTTAKATSGFYDEGRNPYNYVGKILELLKLWQFHISKRVEISINSLTINFWSIYTPDAAPYQRNLDQNSLSCLINQHNFRKHFANCSEFTFNFSSLWQVKRYTFRRAVLLKWLATLTLQWCLLF